MCGIAGIFHPDVPKPVDPARVEAMSDSLAHRGPDGSDVWTAPGVGFGHRRLAIIDLRDAASQPMLAPDRRQCVMFNGEIYNFREVRKELEAKGFGFRTESDTEVILAAWRVWGPDEPRQAQRHVRDRALRRRRGQPVPRPRPARREAALLHRAQRRRPDLRLGAQGPARPPADAPHPERAGGRGFPRLRLRPRRRLDRRGREEAPRRPLSPHPPRPPGAEAGAMVGRRFLQSRPQAAEGARGGDDRAARRGGALAHGRGRAARRLPLRRGRQLGGGRLHGRGDARRGRDLLDRLRRGRS